MTRRIPFHEAVKDHPFAPVSWRWERARKLIENGGYACKSHDDGFTVRVVRFLRGISKAGTDRAMSRVRDRDPDVFDAATIRETGGQAEFELQARLLARQAYAEVGHLLCLNPATVEAYTAIFFDIAGRDHSPGYVERVVLGCRPGEVPSPWTMALLAAFYHGPEVIPAWMDYLDHIDEVHDLGTAEGRSREAIELCIKSQQLKEVPTEGQKMLNLYPWLLKIDQKRPRGRRVGAVLRARAKEVIRRLLPDNPVIRRDSAGCEPVQARAPAVA